MKLILLSFLVGREYSFVEVALLRLYLLVMMIYCSCILSTKEIFPHAFESCEMLHIHMTTVERDRAERDQEHEESW